MSNLSSLKKILLFSFCALAPLAYGQNVGINTSGAAPSVNAILDLNSGNTGRNMGLIIPHVALTSTLTQFNPPIVSGATIKDTGMMVYNTNAAAGNGVGYYYWNGNTWVSVSLTIGSGLTSADNGLSLSGTVVQLGGPVSTPAPLLQNSVISGSNFNLDFDLGTYSTTGAGSFLVTNGGLSTPLLSVTSNTPGVGVNINPALSTLDVNGSIATRETSVTIISNGQLITVGNSSYIIITSTASACTGSYSFSLTNGQPGQELVLEESSGNANLPNTGNVQLASLASLVPYATLSLKWDNINSVWVEITRNGLTSSTPPTSTISFSWNGITDYYTGSVQTWTVPACATTITVTAVGASGMNSYGGAIGGLGASITGTVTVTPGHVLDITVAGQGTDPAINYGSGAGGGTYIWDATSSTLLVVAGGGGGAAADFFGPPYYGGNNGQTNISSLAALEAANVALGNCGAGGVGGGAGTIGTGGTIYGGAGGAGWTTSFTTLNWVNSTAYCPTCAPTPGQGGIGSTPGSNGNGGYGGGGGGAYNAGGGGGGYNGGGGGNGNSGFAGFGGGGGGSYWLPASFPPSSSTTGSASSNGSVTITY